MRGCCETGIRLRDTTAISCCSSAAVVDMLNHSLGRSVHASAVELTTVAAVIANTETASALVTTHEYSSSCVNPVPVTTTGVAMLRSPREGTMVDRMSAGNTCSEA